MARYGYNDIWKQDRCLGVPLNTIRLKNQPRTVCRGALGLRFSVGLWFNSVSHFGRLGLNSVAVLL